MLLPQINLIDIRQKKSDEQFWPFDRQSICAIEGSLNNKKQVLVFVNRLGFASYMQCRACGHQFNCPNCSLNLRLFRKKGYLSCNYCDYKIKIPEICPACTNMNIYQVGFGTEKLQEVLQQHFQAARIERFDRDEIVTFRQLNRCLQRFHQGEIDILVGTQMLSKGHDFQNVNLVIVLGMDSQLNFPDFRANERGYQLLTQVSGRSGRYSQDGQVIIQTLNPESKVFKYIIDHSFDLPYLEEIALRKYCFCPPFSKMAVIYLTSKFPDKVRDNSLKAKALLSDLQKKHFPQVEILGPRAALVEKRVNKYTWAIMVRSSDINGLHNMVRTMKNNCLFHYSISVKIDIDPYHIY